MADALATLSGFFARVDARAAGRAYSMGNNGKVTQLASFEARPQLLKGRSHAT
jgi:hypothetical protein